MKIKRVLIVFILMIVTMINTSYAATQAYIYISPEKSKLNKGDEFFAEVSMNNTSIQEGIDSFMGVLEFDSSILELVKLDINDFSASQQEFIKSNMLNTMDILYYDDICFIGNFEGFLTIIYLNENDSIEIGKNEVMGKIKFKVLNSAKAGDSKISIKEGSANEDLEVADFSTTITIGDTQGSIEDPGVIINPDDQPTVDDEIEWLEPEIEIDENEVEEEEPIQGNIENNIEEQESDEDIPGLGAEDYIPFIIVTLLVAIVSFSKYRKYRGI